MRDTKSLYTLSEPKSAGQQVKETLIYLIAVAIIYYAVVYTVKIITAPFRILFMSDRQRFAGQVERAKAKVRARALAREAYDTSEANPMYQYLLRFKVSPEQFKNDSDNKVYQEWFENLKNGMLLDSDLNWAPEVYEKVYGENVLNGGFLDYFSQQYDMHLVAGLRAKLRFMRTIQKFYPEFTARFSVIPSELADLRARLQNQKIRAEILGFMEGSGVPLEIAEMLIREKTSAADIKAAIRVVQKCQARNYGVAMCRFCVEHKFNPEQHEGHIVETVNNILENTQNEAMALAMVRGDIKPEEITVLVKRAMGESSSMEDLLGNIDRGFRKVMKSKTLSLVGR